jgi:hypothetical protein
MFHRRLASALVLLPVVLLPAHLEAQMPAPEENRPFFAGATLLVTQPVGDFADYVGHGFGLGMHFLYRPVRSRVFALRVDGGYVNYGNETKRVPLSETVGGRIMVDVSTTNNIIVFGVGPQLMVPDGRFRPYVNGGIGLGYFFTRSAVRDDLGGDAFAETTNYSDVTLSWSGGGGVYVPLHRGRTTVSLDAGIRYYRNGESRYLREGSIVDGPGGTVTITPIRSETNFFAWQLGVSVRLPPPEPSSFYD